MARQAFRFKFSGAKELERALNELPKATRKSVLRAALRKAAVPVVNDARRMAPRGDEPGYRMADSITVGAISKRQSRGDAAGGVVVGIGPTSNHRHAHLVEFGTGERISKTGKSSGRMPARPFLRPAWDANRARVFKALKAELWDKLAKAAKRLAKRAEAGKTIRGLS